MDHASAVYDEVTMANSIFPINQHEAQLRRDHLIAANAKLQALDRQLGLLAAVLWKNPENFKGFDNAFTVWGELIIEEAKPDFGIRRSDRARYKKSSRITGSSPALLPCLRTTGGSVLLMRTTLPTSVMSTATATPTTTTTPTTRMAWPSDSVYFLVRPSSLFRAKAGPIRKEDLQPLAVGPKTPVDAAVWTLLAWLGSARVPSFMDGAATQL